jgi:hypothetical protein
MKKFIIRILCLSSFISTILFGCRSSSPAIRNTEISVLPIYTLTAPLGRLIITPSTTQITPGISSSFTPTSPASTLIPSTTISITETPLTVTGTPNPTLTISQARIRVQDLFESNGGCKLPCWWGITPGLTKWQEAKRFYEDFALVVDPITTSEIQSAAVKVPTPYEVSYARTLTQNFILQNGVVNKIYLYNYDFAPNYNLVNILNGYGKPDAVLTSGYYEKQRSGYIFSVAVFYLSKGFLVEYTDGGKEISGENYQICPQRSKSPFLFLWDVKDELSLSDAQKMLDLKNWPDFKPLEVATNIGLEAFYQIFKAPNATTCFEIPKKNWPVY